MISPGALRGGPGHPVTGCCHRTDCPAELPAVSHGPWGPLRAATRSSTKDPRAGQEPVCRNPGPRSQTPTLPGDHQPSRGRPWDGRHGRGGPCSGGVACSGRHDWGQPRGDVGDGCATDVGKPKPALPRGDAPVPRLAPQPHFTGAGKLSLREENDSWAWCVAPGSPAG